MALGWKRMVAGGAVALGLLGPACSNYGGVQDTTAPAGSGPASSQPGATQSSGGVTCKASAGKTAVVQQGFAFHPAKFTAKTCTTVRISNKDSITHTFTINKTSITVTMPGGSQNAAQLALPPGKYTFYCKFHGKPDGTGMAGTLTVT
jgi:plastocyanin